MGRLQDRLIIRALLVITIRDPMGLSLKSSVRSLQTMKITKLTIKTQLIWHSNSLRLWRLPRWWERSTKRCILASSLTMLTLNWHSETGSQGWSPTAAITYLSIVRIIRWLLCSFMILTYISIALWRILQSKFLTFFFSSSGPNLIKDFTKISLPKMGIISRYTLTLKSKNSTSRTIQGPHLNQLFLWSLKM